jgi:hypothetical protein
VSTTETGDSGPEITRASLRQGETGTEETCGAVKQGGVTLRCTEPKDHGESWHKATYTDHREIDYDGAHHVIHMVETVTWKPVDLIREATRHLMAGRPEVTG